MAIDSETKRRSAQQGAAGNLRPVADGTVGTADRAVAAWFYSGLTYDAPSAEITIIWSAVMSVLLDLIWGPIKSIWDRYERYPDSN